MKQIWKGGKCGAWGSDGCCILYSGSWGSPSVNASLAPHQEKTTSKQRHCSKGRRMRSAAGSGVFKKPLPLGPKQRQEEAGHRSQGCLQRAQALPACWTFKEPTDPSTKRWVESNAPATAGGKSGERRRLPSWPRDVTSKGALALQPRGMAKGYGHCSF